MQHVHRSQSLTSQRNFVAFLKHVSERPTKFHAIRYAFLTLLFFAVGAAIFAHTHAAYAQTPVTYYVDCTAGNDTYSGTNTDQAWKTVNKANAAPLKPGDKLLFKRGCSWNGPLKANWVGTAAQPITIGAYGSGSLPRFKDAYSTNVQISGSYQILEYLEVTLLTPPSPDANCQNQPVGWKVGFPFGSTAAYNTLRHSKAQNMAMGVFFDYTSHHNKVLNNTIVNNNVVWKLSATESLGAMGILLHGDHNEIGYNYFANNKTICTYTGTIESNSIELYGARNSKIHHNTSVGDRVFSELGSDANNPSYDNTFAYNVHVVGAMTSSIGSRFVITRGQGHAFGPVWRTKVYNNTLYHTGSGSKGITCQNCGSDVLVVKNNVLWVNNEPISVDAAFVESNNIYWSNTAKPLINFTRSATSKVVNPMFVDAANNNFRLQATSTVLDTGSSESVSAGYVKDLDNVAVPQALAVDPGAYEWAAVVVASESGQNIPAVPVEEPAEMWVEEPTKNTGEPIIFIPLVPGDSE